MSAADEIVLAIQVARFSGKSEREVQEFIRRMGEQYSTDDLEAARKQLAQAIARGER